MDEEQSNTESGRNDGPLNLPSDSSGAGAKPLNDAELGTKTLAAWEIISVSSSFMLAAWTIGPLAGESKLVGALPVALAFALMWLSHGARQETARALGWRLDNFLAAARLLIPAMLAASVVILLIGWMSRSLRLEWALILPRLLWLPVWGLMQEYVMQGFINRRAQLILGRGWRSVLLVAALFALFHLPNPWLMLATFAGGLLWASVYQRVPNLPAIGLSHGLMSLLLASELPTSTLNSLRVGFKYFGYN